MEALTISAANLDTIEKNLGAVADELTGVITNVNSVNNEVNKVQERVSNLNNEVKGLVKEIRENTIISNARQAIMYNNSIIEKKYGYYDNVRRTTESLINALESPKSQLNLDYLKNLREEILMHNPNYWLSDALAAIISWLNNDKENTDISLANAIQKDNSKTSLFFSLISLKLNRPNTSMHWLKSYLESESPLELDKNFIVILDLISTGIYGDEAKELILNKINEWFKKLNSEPTLRSKELSTWQEFIASFKPEDIPLPNLEPNTPDIANIKSNLAISSIYVPFSNYIENLLYTPKSNKNIDEILSDLIYEYEEKEQIYQNDNLKNQLIISCNGNREEALKLYEKEVNANDNKQDIFSLLTNIVIHKDRYHLSNETLKIAISLVKGFITETLTKEHEQIKIEPFSIKINNFTTTTTDGTNLEEIKNDLNDYVNKEFNDEDKDLIVILLIINIIGIIGIFITLNNRLLSTILIIIVVLGNLIFFYKLNKRNRLRTTEKNKLRNDYLSRLEKILAETVDYIDVIKANEEHYNTLLVKINNLETKSYITSNNERNIILDNELPSIKISRNIINESNDTNRNLPAWSIEPELKINRGQK